MNRKLEIIVLFALVAICSGILISMGLAHSQANTNTNLSYNQPAKSHIYVAKDEGSNSYFYAHGDASGFAYARFIGETDSGYTVKVNDDGIGILTCSKPCESVVITPVTDGYLRRDQSITLPIDGTVAGDIMKDVMSGKLKRYAS